MCVMTVLARYLSSLDNLAPVAGRRASRSAENPAKVIIRPANAYKSAAPLTSMSCSPYRRTGTALNTPSCSENHAALRPYSHSMVPGGLDVTS